MEKEKHMLKKLLITVLFIMFLFPSFSLTSEQIAEGYDAIFTGWIEGRSSSPMTINRLQDLRDSISDLPEGSEKYYWEARVSLALGQIFFYQEDENQSLEYLQQSKDFASKALGYSKNSENWRLLSEAGSFIMVQKGVGYIIANSSIVQEDAEEALRLDDRNARASLIIAQGLINAPAIFGGDKKKGMAMMDELADRPLLSTEDRFFILMAKAESLEEMRKKREAEETYKELRGLFPGNSIINQRLRKF